MLNETFSLFYMKYAFRCFAEAQSLLLASFVGKTYWGHKSLIWHWSFKWPSDSYMWCFSIFSSSKNHIRCHISFYNKWSLFCRLTGIETVTHSLEDLNHFIIQLESKWNIGKLTEVNWGENIFWLMIPPKWQYILKKECCLAPSEFSWKSPSN